MPRRTTLFERLVNGRQADIGGDLEVVEPDDGEIVGHFEALEAGGLQDAEGSGVRGGEDRRRQHREREQLAR